MSFGRPDHEQELSYGSYLRVQEILGMQQLRSDPMQHDELLFIVIHQVYELWFKQILHEIDGVVARLQGDDVLGATRLLRRCIEIQRVLVSQITVLETMSPTDFLTFRDHIMPASGFQSAQFREIEFVSGSKDPGMLVHARPTPEERERLQARLDNPSVRDALYQVCRRRGFDIPEPGDDAPEEVRQEARDRRVMQLSNIYRDQQSHFDLFLLCEALVEYDEMFTLWRLRHVQMVERVIGWKPGTGGSSGAAYLRTTVERRFFPDLWDLRTHLGAPAL
ncbi:MAG TPA: tryptophan 2,3-dioxygenase family protein [Longimicrobium sp.]|nr:tryptophan 2,3-dioxygenase family protein [Longimicrobium sp.]